MAGLKMSQNGEFQMITIKLLCDEGARRECREEATGLFSHADQEILQTSDLSTLALHLGRSANSHKPLSWARAQFKLHLSN